MALNRDIFRARLRTPLFWLCTLLLLLFLVPGESVADHDPSSHDQLERSESVFGDPFDEILTGLNDAAAAESRNVTEAEMAGLLVTIFEERLRCSENVGASICRQCLSVEDLFTILNLNPNLGLCQTSFHRASVVLLYYVTNLIDNCANATLKTNDYDYFASRIQTRGDGAVNLSEEELGSMIDAVAVTYVADNLAKCFDVESIFEASVTDHSLGANTAELEELSAITIASIIQGFCIGSPSAVDPDAFLEYVYDNYAADDHMTEDELIVIINKLSIGGTVANQEAMHNHEAVKRRKRNVDVRRHHRSLDAHDHTEVYNNTSLPVTSCFSVDDLLMTFGVNHSLGVSQQQFKELSPALIQQVVSDACIDTGHTVEVKVNAAAVWGYGILAVFIISLCAVVGVAFLPCLDTALYLKVLQTMMALAVATLVGDAIIHLIPQALGLHQHDTTVAQSHTAHDSPTHSVGAEELAFVWKCLVVVTAIYIFFLFESLMQMFGGRHSHSSEPNCHHSNNVKLKSVMNGSFRKSNSKNQLEMMEDDTTVEDAQPAEGNEEHRKTVCCGIGSLPFMILIGDGLHNFGDGLAIGAAFSTSLGAGLSTSIAVLCHELPHELGDFAVLLNAGLSFRKALVLNFLSALMAFVGLCIGIPLAGNSEARQWIFAVAAGMFLYVALVDMFPELIHHKMKNKGTIFLLHNLGFLTGTAIIVIIAFYEDAINISL